MQMSNRLGTITLKWKKSLKDFEKSFQKGRESGKKDDGLNS
jgi:hypothetical protein